MKKCMNKIKEWIKYSEPLSETLGTLKRPNKRKR